MIPGGSWHFVWIRHNDPRVAKDSWGTVLQAQGARPSILGTGCDDPDRLAQWLTTGEQLSYPAPWLVFVKQPRHAWVQVLWPGENSIELAELGGNGRLHVLSAAHDYETRMTQLRSYRAGRLEMDLKAQGGLEERPSMLSTNSRKTSTESGSAKTVRILIEQTFKEREVPPLRFVCEAEERRVRINLHQGHERAAEISDIENMRIEYYARLMKGEHPPSDRLFAALNRVDVKAVKAAIAEGARLDMCPETSASPLAIALSAVGREGWDDCVRALITGGAPMEGFWWEDPILVQAVSPFRPDEKNLEPVKLALELGADVNARSRKDDLELTALHKAVAARQVKVAAHLIKSGARTDLKGRPGFTAEDYARNSGDARLLELFVKRKSGNESRK